MFHPEEVNPIEIKSNDSKNEKKSKKRKVKNDDLTFWTRNCKNEIQLLCKTKYYETINEILFIYSSLKERAFSICNDIYEIYLGEIYMQSEKSDENESEKMPNILARIAEFKIRCWHEADLVMQDHKFI